MLTIIKSQMQFVKLRVVKVEAPRQPQKGLAGWINKDDGLPSNMLRHRSSLSGHCDR